MSGGHIAHCRRASSSVWPGVPPRPWSQMPSRVSVNFRFESAISLPASRPFLNVSRASWPVNGNVEVSLNNFLQFAISFHLFSSRAFVPDWRTSFLKYFFEIYRCYIDLERKYSCLVTFSFGRRDRGHCPWENGNMLFPRSENIISVKTHNISKFSKRYSLIQ